MSKEYVDSSLIAKRMSFSKDMIVIDFTLTLTLIVLMVLEFSLDCQYIWLAAIIAFRAFLKLPFALSMIIYRREQMICQKMLDEFSSSLVNPNP